MNEGAITVWHARQSPDFQPGGGALQHLDSEELRRYRDFENAENARFFSFRRAMRRVLLARVLGCAPRSIGITFGPMGKPMGPCPFSTSHSRSIAVVATANAEPVGVDIELKDRPISANLQPRLLSNAERGALQHTPKALRRGLLLQAWTVKEAAIKANGGALRIADLRLMTAPPVIRPGSGWSRMDYEGRLACSYKWWVHLDEIAITDIRVLIAVATPAPLTISYRSAASILQAAGVRAI